MFIEDPPFISRVIGMMVRMNPLINRIATEILKRAFIEANKIETKELRDRILSSLVVMSSQLGLLNYAKSWIKKIEDKDALVLAVRNLVADLSRKGLNNEAKEILEEAYYCIAEEENGPTFLEKYGYSTSGVLPNPKLVCLKDEILRVKTLLSLEKGDLPKAEECIDSITNPYIKILLKTDLAVAYARNSKYGKAIRLFRESLDLVKETNNKFKMEKMEKINSDMICRNLSLVAAIALKMQKAGLNEWSRDILTSLSTIIRRIHNGNKRCRLLIYVLRMARSPEFKAEVSPLIKIIDSRELEDASPEILSLLYKELSLYYHLYGEISKFVEAMNTALKYAEKIESSKLRDNILLNIARDCMESGIVGCPKIIAGRVKSIESRNKIICDLCNTIARRGYINYAIEMLNRFGESIGFEIKNEYMAYLLGNALNLFLCSGNDEKAQRTYFDILRILELIKDQYRKALILTILLTYLLQGKRFSTKNANSKRFIIIPHTLVRGETLKAV